MARLSDEELGDALKRWELAARKRAELPPLSITDLRTRPVTGEVKEYFDRIREKPIFNDLTRQYGGYEFGYVSTDSLISPLVVIDYEYIEELKAELSGEVDLSLARFAVPEAFVMPLKGAADPASQSITFASSQKTLMVSGPRTRVALGSGLEVSFLITAAATMIIASKVGERLYLRSGIHRAFLLASMGKKEFPCILVRENQLSALTSAYPAFNPSVLLQTRPPLLADFLNESLALTVPIQRTHKVIRISAEDFVVPVD